MYDSIMTPMVSFQDPERMEYCFDRWKRPCHWDSYDTINTSESELYKMLPQLESMSQAERFIYFDNPSLLNFVLNVWGEENNGTAKILFKKTIMEADDSFIELGENFEQKNYPFVDAYVSFDGDDRHDVVVTLGYALVEAGGTTVCATAHNLVWIDEHVNRDLLAAAQGALRNVKLAYLLIQKAIMDRPTIFTERKISRPIECSKKKRNKKRKVRVIRVLRVNQEELAEYTKTHRKIECPCWGVMGHWRKYKSGKEVWIAPYRKGRERDNPNAYSPKEYQLEEESVCK